MFQLIIGELTSLTLRVHTNFHNKIIKHTQLLEEAELLTARRRQTSRIDLKDFYMI